MPTPHHRMPPRTAPRNAHTEITFVRLGGLVGGSFGGKLPKSSPAFRRSLTFCASSNVFTECAAREFRFGGLDLLCERIVQFFAKEIDFHNQAIVVETVATLGDIVFELGDFGGVCFGAERCLHRRGCRGWTLGRCCRDRHCDYRRRRRRNRGCGSIGRRQRRRACIRRCRRRTGSRGQGRRALPRFSLMASLNFPVHFFGSDRDAALGRFLADEFVVNQIFQCFARDLQQGGLLGCKLVLIILEDLRHGLVVRVKLLGGCLNLREAGRQ